MAGRRQRIYPRTTAKGEKRYDVSFDFIDHATGRRRQQMRTFTSEKAARQALAEHEARMGKGPRYYQTDVTLAQCAEAWLLAHAACVRPTTLQTYRATLRTHILPQLGQVPTSRLSLRRLEDHYRELRAAGVSDGLIRNTHQRLVQILRWAALRDYAVDASALQTRTPRYTAREMTCWTDDEMAQFLRIAGQDKNGLIWRVALHTGMRRAELMGLRWQDIDWDNHSVRVVETRTKVGGRIIVGPTKNGQSRTISVPGSLIDALRAHRAAQLADRVRVGSLWREPELVFTNEHGACMVPETLRRRLDALLEQAGLGRIRIHDLRHTHASFLLRHGKSVVEVSKRLGHKNVAQTLNTYAHCIPDEHKATADLLGRMFG